MTSRVLAAAACLAIAGGCAIGPNYVRPEVSAPGEYRGQVGPAEAASLADLPWWEVFEDEVLQQLILEALAGSYDLKTATARVEQAQALLGVARSPFYPQVGYQGSGGRQRDPEWLGTPSNTYDLFFGAFSLAWEIDVWGRIRRASEAARERLFAAEEVRRGVLLSLTTAVAQSYLRLLELDRELEIARATVKSFEETLELFDRQFTGGVGNKLQVERAAAALAQTQAVIPDLELRIVSEENALSVLLGRAPAPIPRGTPLAARSAPPATPPGLPSALLERRPDVLQAEHTLAAANAEVGVSIANFFPQIGLTALYGGQSTELSDLLKNSFSVWNVAGTAAGPVFQGFSLLQQYRAQVAAWEEAKSRYQQTVLTAFGEVSTALTAQTKLAEVKAAQERTVRAYQESVRLSLVRYTSGLAGYFEVLEAQQRLFPAEITLAQVQREQLLTVVTLYRTLGGGWQLSDDQWNQKP